VLAATPVELTTEALESLRAATTETKVAQRDLLMMIDLIESRPCLAHSETDGNAIHRLETGLHKLYVRLGRILYRAEYGIPVLLVDGR
jgi:hypothetical protein